MSVVFHDIKIRRFIMLSFQTPVMQSQRRMGVERMEMDIAQIYAVKKFGAKFVANIYPIPLANVLRKKCIIDEPFYREILQMRKNHAPRRDMCEKLVNETTKNCNLTQLIEVLYFNGFRDLAKGLFLCDLESRNEAAVCRFNRADTSNRRKIGNFFKHIKQLVHAMTFNDAYSDVKDMGITMKQKISDTDDPRERMNKCDKFIALKAAEMDALTNTAGIVSKDHPGYLEMARYVSSSSNPALSEVILYGRQSDVLSTIGEFQEAENFMRQALVSADTSCSCVEVTDMIYKNVVVKLSKFEKHPYDEELRKSILLEADRGLWTLEGESEDLRIFWTKLFLLRMAFAHLGIGKFCDIVQNYVPSRESIAEAERILELDELKNLEHRRQMFFAVAKARLEEWNYDMEAAMDQLMRARELAKEGKYAEDRALAVYQSLLINNPDSSISPSSIDDSTVQKNYFTTDDNDTQCQSRRSIQLEIGRTVSGTSVTRSREHLDPQFLSANDCETVSSNISTNGSLGHLDPLSMQANYSQPSSGNTGAPHEIYEKFYQTSNVVSSQPETSLDSNDDSYPSLEHLHTSSFES